MPYKKIDKGWQHVPKGEEDEETQDLIIGGFQVDYFKEDASEEPRGVMYDEFGYPLIPGTHEIDWDKFEEEHPDGCK